MWDADNKRRGAEISFYINKPKDQRDKLRLKEIINNKCQYHNSKVVEAVAAEVVEVLVVDKADKDRVV